MAATTKSDESDTLVVTQLRPRRRLLVLPWPPVSADSALVVVPAFLLVVLGYQHRWMSDDGLIFQRVVRQILAGNGPVFNAGDRAESASSTLWAYLVAAVSWATRINPSTVAVFGGLLLTGAGFGLAIDATRRLWTRSHSGVFLPVGALVVLALPPFWDFATSGLETGLAFFWLGLVWRLLVALRLPGAPLGFRHLVGIAFVFGLGPLVRPELGLVSVCAAVTMLLTLWPLGWRRTTSLIAALLGLPLAYEIFRAAYFGVLVPLPGIAKAASGSDLNRGYHYFLDFVAPYWLPLPAALLAALLFIALRNRPRDERIDWLLMVTPAAAGFLLAVYVVRLGGDFMHARMWLNTTFLLLLPVLILPARTTAAILAFLGLAGWASWCAVVPRPDQPTVAHPYGSARGFVDERAFWLQRTGNAHPTTAGPYVRLAGLQQVLDSARAQAKATGRGVLVVLPEGFLGWEFLPLRRGLPWKLVLVYSVLGTAGANLRLDEAAVDAEGLAFPLAAHAALVRRTRPGHEKVLPTAYIVAALADPTAQSGLDATALAAAREVLACPAVRELEASTLGSLTFHRLLSNLTHSISRTREQVPIRANPEGRC